MAIEPEKKQEVRKARRRFVFDVLDWVQALTNRSAETGESEIEIAAFLIREGGSGRGFGPDKANSLIEATKHTGKAKKAGQS